ncbi:hypothetical protein PQR71_42100 [Paraburkholderia fungorum]|uniref:hypothetical protein n=1 Tax=Paraburkholderia fungorum TaxID=134537 RepID=UPI0038BD38B5
MSKPKTKIYEIVELIRQHGPVSPNRLTNITGDIRQSIDKYVRQAHDAGLIHIAALGPSPFGGNRTVKLYAYGKGIDAQRHHVSKPAVKRATRKPKNDESRRCKNFSPAEKRIIREIKLGGQSVKSQMHRLPGRTFWSVQKAVAMLKGTKKRGVGSWIWAASISVLKEEPGLSAKDIADRIGCSKRQVNTLMGEHRGQGVFVSEWVMHRRTLCAKWSLGNQDDVPRPPKQSIEEKHQKARMWHRQRVARTQRNPFATALGLVAAPSIGVGRIYQQDMTIHSEELEAA